MPSDIVQAIDRAIEKHEGMVKACELWRPPTEHCPFCQQRAKDADKLRALRDHIEEYRKAWAARLNSNTSTAFMERMHDAERALLAFCREVGT